MSLTDPQRTELLALSNAAADGQLEGAGLSRLEELLLDSEEARQFYVRFMTLSAGLVTMVQDGRRVADVDQEMLRATAVVPTVETAGNYSLRRWKWIAMAAAACLFIAGTFLALHLLHGTGQAARADVAVMGETLDPIWADDSHNAGDYLKPGMLNLKSGFARIRFFNGAIVALEGPAEFEVISAREGYCRRGKLVAKVPPEARDFELRSPVLSVVDAGGWYGIQLTPSATGIPSAIVHVFQGEASIQRDHMTLVSLIQGEALAVSEGVDQRLEADSHGFEEWDFVQRSERAYSPHHDNRPSWMEGIFTLIEADARRRVELEPQLERLLEALRAVHGDSMAVDDPVWHGWADLNQVFLNGESTDAEFTASLTQLREAKTAARKNLHAAQESLRGELTLREEAVLLIAGWIE